MAAFVPRSGLKRGFSQFSDRLGGGGPSFAAESDALFSRLAPLSEARATFIDTMFMRPLVLAGIYQKLRAFYPFMLARSQAESLVDWSPANNPAAIAGGNMAFTAGEGYKRVDSGAYIGNNFGTLGGARMFHGFLIPSEVVGGAAGTGVVEDFNSTVFVRGQSSGIELSASSRNRGINLKLGPREIYPNGSTFGSYDRMTPLRQFAILNDEAAAIMALYFQDVRGENTGVSQNATLPSGIRTGPNVAVQYFIPLICAGLALTQTEARIFTRVVENLGIGIPA